MNISQKKIQAIIIIMIALLVGLVVFSGYVLIYRHIEQEKTTEVEPKKGNGLFSWHDEVFEMDEREILFRIMKDQGMTELYQDVPHDMPASKIKEFSEACEANGIKLYLLVGAPEWALDQDAVELRAEIQRAALMGFDGVMVDIEPGSTDEWKEDRESVMPTMTQAFLRGKSAAEENGIEMIVCLSYYYDDYGFEDELETIVEHGCDALAIMNYDREDELGQIETEAALCKKYEKALINVYELQEAGKYDLEEINTYHEAGLSALQNSWLKISKVIQDQDISMAIHEYRSLKEMTGS